MKDALKILQQYWGHHSFRGSQEDIIEAVMMGKDVLTLMPTAGGKSVCYQIPAMLQEGICIVVSPLVALIEDQVNQLKSKEIKAIALTGGLSYDELTKLLDNCIYGKYKFLYLSPERLQQTLVRERIAQMPLNLFAIDEAHCISQWGHDFRPAYLQCSILRELHPEVNMIALTATATKMVIHDIITNLKFVNGQVYKDSFHRNNLSYEVVEDENKFLRLYELCKSVQKSGLIYVRTRRKTVELVNFLNKKGITADFFHGGLPKQEKDKKLQQWLSNSVQFMVATNAFGMGVNKPDVELVVHYQIPDCIENYFQESGRAGRDGKPARAVLITNKAEELKTRNRFVENLPDISFISLLYRKLNNYFQVSYGELPEEQYSFNFNDFCETYQLNSSRVYNGLQILDQYSVLSFSQSFNRRTQLQFLVGKAALIAYLEKNQDIAHLVQNILRTYGGIFDFMTRINPTLVAKKSNAEENDVLRVLKRLSKDGIIDYIPGHTDLEISFLVPREDDHTINAFAPQMKAHQQRKKDQFAAMLNYVSNTRKCRVKQLLGYFSEQCKTDCGQCDVCLRKDHDTMTNGQNISREILAILEKSSKTSRELINSLPFDEQAVLHMLQQMLENDLISINTKNEYLILE